MPSMTRRDFLKLASGSLAAWTVAPPTPSLLPRLAFVDSESGPAGDVLVVVFQRGGLDGLNAVVPFGEAAYFQSRPTLAVAEPSGSDPDKGIDLDGFFGLHPALAPLKGPWEAGDLAIAHAVGSPDPTHSHFDAMDFMERGTPGEKQIPTGWLARHLQSAAWENDSPLRAVGFGSMLQSSLRGPVPATALKSIADFHLGGRSDVRELEVFQASLAGMYALDPALNPAADLTMRTADTLGRIIAEAYTPAGGAQYPDTEFGRSLQQVAQLIKAGVGLEIAAVDIGGWDTHAAQGGLEGAMPALLAEFAAGLGAFYTDLGVLMAGITVVSMSEFGRRLAENGSQGTDHGHGGVMFALGGGINGGKVYTDWPGLAPEQLYGPGDLSITTDFRDVLGEIVQQRLKNPEIETVFPGYVDWKFRGLAG